MMTKTPNCDIIESLDKEMTRRETASNISIEVPLQQLFDEMLVFISKTDLE